MITFKSSGVFSSSVTSMYTWGCDEIWSGYSFLVTYKIVTLLYIEILFG